MRQVLTDYEWSNTPPQVQAFITRWLERKHYPTPITLGYCLELLIATTYNLKKEDSDGRFFNRLLKNNESLIGWDGEELIAILWYEVTEAIKQRIATAGTLTEQT